MKFLSTTKWTEDDRAMSLRALALAACFAAARCFAPPALGAPRAAAPLRATASDEEVSPAAIKEWMETMDPDDLDEELDLSEVPTKAMPPPDVTVDEANAAAYLGDYDGTDDALEEPWRVEAAGVARAAGEATGVVVKDLYWEPGVLRVAVTKADGSTPDAEDCAAASRAMVAALEERDDELRVLSRHDLEVTSPGASDVLTMQSEFDAFKGYDVAAKTANPIHPDETRTVEGKLVERTIDTLVINVKGRMVKLPWHLVEEVKLPPAKKE